MKKICVTIIFGDYDNLKEPTVVNPDWKYYVISDRHHKSNVWKTKLIKDEKVKRLTNKLKTGYVISQLHKIVDYDLAILVGGQIQINVDLNTYTELKYDFVATEHPSRNCIYEEAFACIMLDKDNPKRIAQTVYRYKNDGLPLDAGMIQTGVTIRKNTKELNAFCDRWWLEICKGSHRDQLSFNYVNWLMPIKYEILPVSIFSKEFKLNKHL